MTETLHEMAKRVCDGHKVCLTCPMWGSRERDGAYRNCVIVHIKQEQTAGAQIEALRAWAAANPVRTYRTDFFEKFPGAPRRDNGFPRAKIADVYEIHDNDKKEYLHISEAECWDKPFGYWDAPLGTWGEKEKPAPVLNERTPPDDGKCACSSCVSEECDAYAEPCLSCVHGEGETENYHASAAEMERRRKNGQ